MKHKGALRRVFSYLRPYGFLLAASLLLRLIEKRMDGADSYELVQTDPLTMTAGTYRHPGSPEETNERNLESERWN